MARVGLVLRGGAAGNRSCMPLASAAQRSLTGQAVHAGPKRRQWVAPKSMIACV